MAARRMKYGLVFRTQYPAGTDMRQGLAEQLEQVRTASRLGYDSIMRGQHYAGWPVQELQTIPFLARAIPEAGSMRIICGIILLPLHKPLDLAEQLSTLDTICDGRLIAGFGLGYREVEYLGFGISQSERVARFEENLAALKRLWTEDHVTMKGSHFELKDTTLSLKPVQKPHPPIWIGANADAAIERAARLGDAWLINMHQTMATIGRQVELYRRTLDGLGKTFPAELPLAREVFVAGSREEAMRVIRPSLEEKYRVYTIWGQDKAMAKGDNDLSLDFEALTRDRFLLGSPDEVAESIADYYRRFGANHMLLTFQGVGTPQAAALESITRFAEEVMPRVEQAI